MWKLLCLVFLLAPGVELRPQTHDAEVVPKEHEAPKDHITLVSSKDDSKEKDIVITKPEVHGETILHDSKLHEKRNAPEHDAPAHTTLKPAHDGSKESSENSKENHGAEGKDHSRRRRDEGQPQSNPAGDGTGDYPETEYDDYYEEGDASGEGDQQQQPPNFVPAVGNRRRRNTEHEEPQEDSTEHSDEEDTTRAPKPHSKRQAPGPDGLDYPAYGAQADYYDDAPVVPNDNIPDFTKLEDVSPLDLTKRSDEHDEPAKTGLPETEFQRKLHQPAGEEQPVEPEGAEEDELEASTGKPKARRETHKEAGVPEGHHDEHKETETKEHAGKETEHSGESKEHADVPHEATRHKRDVLKAGSSDSKATDSSAVFHAKPAIETLVAVPVARPEDEVPRMSGAHPEDLVKVKRETGHDGEHKEAEKEHEHKEDAHEDHKEAQHDHKEDEEKEHEEHAQKEKREAEHGDEHKVAQKEHGREEHAQEDKKEEAHHEEKEHDEKEHDGHAKKERREAEHDDEQKEAEKEHEHKEEAHEDNKEAHHDSKEHEEKEHGEHSQKERREAEHEDEHQVDKEEHEHEENAHEDKKEEAHNDNKEHEEKEHTEQSKKERREAEHTDEHKEPEKEHEHQEDAHEDKTDGHLENKEHDAKEHDEHSQKERREAEHDDENKEAVKEHGGELEHVHEEKKEDAHKDDKSKEHDEHASPEDAHPERHTREDHQKKEHSSEEEKQDDSAEKQRVATTTAPNHGDHDSEDHHRQKRADIYAHRRPYVLKRGRAVEDLPVRRKKSSEDHGANVKPGTAIPVGRPNNATIPKPVHRQRRQAGASKPAILPVIPVGDKKPAAGSPAAQPGLPTPRPSAIPRPQGTTQKPLPSNARPARPSRPAQSGNQRPNNARPGSPPSVPPRTRPARPAQQPATKPVAQQTPAAKPVGQPTPAAKPAAQPTPAAKPAAQPSPATRPGAQPAPQTKPAPAPGTLVRTKREDKAELVNGHLIQATHGEAEIHEAEHQEEVNKDKEHDKEEEHAETHHERKTRNEPVENKTLPVESKPAQAPSPAVSSAASPVPRQQLEVKPAPGPVLVQESNRHVNDQNTPHAPVVQLVLDRGLKQEAPGAKAERKDVQADAHAQPKSHAAGHWTYGDDEAFDEWNSMFPVCSGPRQSPINIQTSDVSFTTFSPWKFDGYDQIPEKTVLKNNGHTAQLEVTLNKVPSVCGGGLPNCYKFAQLHFHWGSKSVQGSEHTINERRFPLEIHLVHYNERYPNISAAVASGAGDALAVLGFLYEISASDNPALVPLTDALKMADSASSVVTVTQQQPLKNLLGKNLMPFFRYEGSLTTPPCSEVVIWTVFEEKIRISEKQLEAFRHIKTEEGDNMVDNYRPVQNEAEVRGNLPPNAGAHRIVYYNNAKEAYTTETEPELARNAKNTQTDKPEPHSSGAGSAARASAFAAFLPAAFLLRRRL